MVMRSRAYPNAIRAARGHVANARQLRTAPRNRVAGCRPAVHVVRVATKLEIHGALAVAAKLERNGVPRLRNRFLVIQQDGGIV